MADAWWVWLVTLGFPSAANVVAAHTERDSLVRPYLYKEDALPRRSVVGAFYPPEYKISPLVLDFRVKLQLVVHAGNLCGVNRAEAKVLIL